MPDTIMNTQEIHFLQQVKGYWVYLLFDYLVWGFFCIFLICFCFLFLFFLVLTGVFCCYFYGLISSQGIITISND